MWVRLSRHLVRASQSYLRGFSRFGCSLLAALDSHDSWTVPVGWCILPTFEFSRAMEMLDECQCSMPHFIANRNNSVRFSLLLFKTPSWLWVCDLKTKERSRSPEPISFCGCSVWPESSVPASSHRTPTVPGIPSTI